MIKIDSYNNKGEKKDPIILKLATDDLKFNANLVSQAVRYEDFKNHRANGKSKTRANVSGGGKKPWRQKGTGRARAGSIRSPLFRHGGVTFGPDGKQEKLFLPAKMRRQALKMLLFQKISNREFSVIENLEVKKTKEAQKIFEKLNQPKNWIIVADDKDNKYLKFWRNIAAIDIRFLSTLKIRDLIGAALVISTLKSFDKISAIIKK